MTIPINDKFKNFPELFCVSLSSCKDRRNYMQNQCKLLGIKNLTFIDAIDGRETDMLNQPSINVWWKDLINSPGVATSLSHLKAIKYWLDNHNSSYAVFCEDDMDFFNSYYWNFKWENLFQIFPKNWDSMQMSLIRETTHWNESIFRIQVRYFDDWSAGCYILKRSYAEKLVRNYYLDDGTIELCIRDDIEVAPLIENVLFNPGWFTQTSYMFPMFVESKLFNSTFYPKFLEKETKGVQMEWVDIVSEWWEKNGRNLSLENVELKDSV